MTPVFCFDIDGTLADITHLLPLIIEKRWDEYYLRIGEARPINHMIELLDTIIKGRGTVVFATGRSDECKKETERWLLNQVTYYDRDTFPLYMRKTDDHRPDTVVKMELLAQMRADGYEPIMVFEDRGRVTKQWRSAGIPCAQVDVGEF